MNKFHLFLLIAVVIISSGLITYAIMPDFNNFAAWLVAIFVYLAAVGVELVIILIVVWGMMINDLFKFLHRNN